ncbi:MAG TPA: hypothetical protein VM051_10205 [Usitatibacter sp.]|nr:hypothetical protein [Usitatibacter sp.]
MALMSDAVMVLFCDVAGDPEDHDDWHSTEHMHERLSIPGFLRGTRWIRPAGSPRYMIVYEVASVEMANAPEYLARLNDPTPWTAATMKRLQGMSRGFCKVTASAGYGLGRAARVVRVEDASHDTRARLANEVERLASLRGIASAHLLEAQAAPPMTKEQSIRGRDAGISTLLLVTGYDAHALERACPASAPIDAATYELGFTATAAEVSRTAVVRPGRPRPAP